MDVSIRVLIKNVDGVTRQAEYETIDDAISRVDEEEMADSEIRRIEWRNPVTGAWERVPLNPDDSTVQVLMEFKPPIAE